MRARAAAAAVVRRRGAWELNAAAENCAPKCSCRSPSNRLKTSSTRSCSCESSPHGFDSLAGSTYPAIRRCVARSAAVPAVGQHAPDGPAARPAPLGGRRQLGAGSAAMVLRTPRCSVCGWRAASASLRDTDNGVVSPAASCARRRASSRVIVRPRPRTAEGAAEHIDGGRGDRRGRAGGARGRRAGGGERPADDDVEVLEAEVPAGTPEMQVEGLDDVDVPVAASDDGAGAQAAQLLAGDRGAAIRRARGAAARGAEPLARPQGARVGGEAAAKDAEAEAKRLEREEAKAAKRAAKQAEEEERQRQKLAQQEEQQKRVEAAAEKRKTKQESTPASTRSASGGSHGDEARLRHRHARRGAALRRRRHRAVRGQRGTPPRTGEFAAQISAHIALSAHHTSVQVRGGGARRHRLAEVRLQSVAHFRHLRRSPTMRGPSRLRRRRRRRVSRPEERGAAAARGVGLLRGDAPAPPTGEKFGSEINLGALVEYRAEGLEAEVLDDGSAVVDPVVRRRLARPHHARHRQLRRRRGDGARLRGRLFRVELDREIVDKRDHTPKREKNFRPKELIHSGGDGGTARAAPPARRRRR